MLSLILISEQPVDQPQRLSLCFDKLIADVTRTLDAKNRDRFTQNLTVFRLEFCVK
uniref:Exportin-1 C-terminal domain-containing protein n=1 Tax=Manihot esculenta TaxID=3983 RepID=A0A2C9W001_MANES